MTDAVRAGRDEKGTVDILAAGHHHSCATNGCARKRPELHPERLVERIERAGFKGAESVLVALAAHATIASPLRDLDLDWIASVAARIGDDDLLLETVGVVFAFNAVNRIADARRVQLEFRFLRQLKPIRGWVERRMTSLVGLAYDLSYRYQPRRSASELHDRLGGLFGCLGTVPVPEVFHWLSRSPVLLEGVLEMIEANVTSAGVRSDLWKEAAAIATASRAMPGSGLRKAVDQWLSEASLPDSHALHAGAAPSAVVSDSCLVSACRQYSWQVANAPSTISDEQTRRLCVLGLSDAELLDLTLAGALFSALAIIEPIGAAVARNGDGRRHELAVDTKPVDSSPASLREELAI